MDCLLLLNELDKDGLGLLQTGIAPFVQRANALDGLAVKVEFYNEKFDAAYPKIKERIAEARLRNVFFNLDQSGYSQATNRHLHDIMTSWEKPEIILTFMVEALLAYISQDRNKSNVPLTPELRAMIDAARQDETYMAQNEWLAMVERLVFQILRRCAPYVSPFSIRNPEGWRYWLMHFANVPRARQVYNDILHLDGNSQGHYGRAGLNMLSYDPSEPEAQIYLFDQSARERAMQELYDDIPRLVAEEGDAMTVGRFYEAVFSETAAHSDDIHASMIENPDIEVITSNGGARREAKAIRPDDTIKLKPQKSFSYGFQV